MKIINLFIIINLILLISFCQDENSDTVSPLSVSSVNNGLSSWVSVKSAAVVVNHLTSEYNTPGIIPIDTMGWEDGINISRNGLHIYATYIPADFLSFVQSGKTLDYVQYYDRGPHYDMDLITNPAGASYPWYQSDIIYASRSSVSENFSAWTTSNMKRSSYSEGGFSAVFSGLNTIDIAIFTSNEEYTADNNFKIFTSVSANPSGIGSMITTTDTSGTSSINTNYIEDNPHIERIDATNLVLFFDSENRPGGSGSHDIWYSITSDNGSNWSTPLPVTSVNTAEKEHQPHLYNDGTDWWLYYSAYYSDGKLAIFRRKQVTSGNWNSWGPAEVVISAGNTAGVGEPTLTSNGDLYFVVVYENPDYTEFDRYDADAWSAVHK